jgi:hypothetical protein
MKKYLYQILLALVILDLISCNENTANTNVERNIELAKKSFDAFNQHNWELQASYFSDTCKFLDPSYGDKHITVNRKDKVLKYSKMEQTSPDINDSITSIFGFGDQVVVQFISTGTAKTEEGDYKWSVPICCVFTFKDNLITVDETYYNRGK